MKKISYDMIAWFVGALVGGVFATITILTVFGK